jgi:hypothetical protein
MAATTAGQDQHGQEEEDQHNGTCMNSKHPELITQTVQRSGRTDRLQSQLSALATTNSNRGGYRSDRSAGRARRSVG